MAAAIGTDMQPLALLRLLQLASPALPVGAFAYSDGLEYAVHAGWVRCASTAQAWILGRLRGCLGRVDAPMLLRLHDAWAAGDTARATAHSQMLLAMRESAELRATDRHLGTALARLLVTLDVAEAELWTHGERTTYAAMFALAAARWTVAADVAAMAYLFTWAESQSIHAVKLVPLGQSAGQRILSLAAEAIPPIIALAAAMADDDIGAGAPGLAIASARHESMYARLYRS